MRNIIVVGSTLSLLALAGCSALGGDEKDKPLPGERVSILELQKTLEPDSDALTAQGFVAPSPWRNEFWPQAGGYPNHAMQHLVLTEGPLTEQWRVSIGKGSSKALPLTAQPIVIDGRIYALDTNSALSAFAAEDGLKLWTVDVRDPAEDDPVIGGGIAYSRGRLLVTNGYDEVLAVSPEDGSLLWRVAIPAPARAAPTVLDDRVFVVTLDNRVVALSALDGQKLWEFSGVNEGTGLVGAASPAAGRDIIVPAFSSGELFALRIENGSVAWAENLAAYGGVSAGLTSLADIRGLPVIDKGLVIAVSFGGRLVAIDERTGSRVWQRDIGSSETPWVAGNHLFVLSTNNEIVALGRDNGVIRWITPLPRFADEDDREDPLFWTNPVLAGGRLLVAGSNGEMIEVQPETGAVINRFSIGRSVLIAPVIADGTLYLLGDDGTLMAFR